MTRQVGGVGDGRVVVGESGKQVQRAGQGRGVGRPGDGLGVGHGGGVQDERGRGRKRSRVDDGGRACWVCVVELVVRRGHGIELGGAEPRGDGGRERERERGRLWGEQVTASAGGRARGRYLLVGWCGLCCFLWAEDGNDARGVLVDDGWVG